MKNIIFIVLVTFCLQSSASELSDIADEIRSCQEAENLSEETCSTIVTSLLDKKKDEIQIYSSTSAHSTDCNQDRLNASAKISAVANRSQIQNLCKSATDDFPDHRYSSRISYVYYSINGRCMNGSDDIFYHHANNQNTVSSCSQKIDEALSGI